uniref:hypothetical protein n=1 Tax=Herbidospora sakaeratensis TaxID=564415 RepID=UPI000ACC998D|nr:hypothetical protein [Herbidospora sakaeratensis]
MFALALGVSWLLLAPVCVWLLFGIGQPLRNRLGAVATIFALEGATIFLATTGHHPAPPPVAAVMPPRPVPSPTNTPCPVRLPHPDEVRLSRTHVTILWPAVIGECDTAAVVLGEKGNRLRVWVHEGALVGNHRASVVPVNIDGSTAFVDVARKLARHHWVAVDGRSGKRIPTITHG